MIANVPILAIGPKDGDLAKIIGETGVGLISDFNNELALEQNILSLFKNQITQRNENAIANYSRKNLTKQLASLLDSL
jgi:hypothetical protein